MRVSVSVSLLFRELPLLDRFAAALRAGLSGVPGREAAFQDTVAATIEAAAVLGARHIHLGPSRVPEGVTAEACRATYLANVRTALGLSRALAASLVVEAMNPVEAPTALVADVREAHQLVRTVANRRLGVLFDVYHVAMAGEDPVAAYRDVAEVVRHVQFADAPGRHEPGSGTLDLPHILNAIQRAGYAGWFGAEYYPAATTVAGLGWSSRFLNHRAA